MSQTPLSSIVARAKQARTQVTSLSRSAFSDLGGGVSRAVGLAGQPDVARNQFRGLVIGDDVARDEAMGPTLTTTETSKFRIVCFSAGTEEACGGSIGNGNTFCLKTDCTISAHKKSGNIVPFTGMIFVQKNGDVAFVDPCMALDRLDPEFLEKWKTDQATLAVWIERMGAAKRGGIFSSAEELKYELELARKAKVFQTPARGPYKNFEETVDLEWQSYSPKMSGDVEDVNISTVAGAVATLELAVIRNESKLKQIGSQHANSAFDTGNSLEMLDVKISGVENEIGLRPNGDIGKSAPTLWGAISHLADGLGIQSKVNLTWMSKLSSMATQQDFASYSNTAQSAVAANTRLKDSVDQGQVEATKVFTLLMDRLDKAEDQIVQLQGELLRSAHASQTMMHPANTGMINNALDPAVKVLEERISKLEVLSDATCVQFCQLGLSSLNEVGAWVRINYGTHRFGLMCDVYLLFDRILGDSDADQLSMMNKMQYQVKCNLSTGSEAMALFSLSHIVPKIFHTNTAGSFGVGRHTSALSQLKTWEEWSDGTHGMKQFILRRLPVVENALMHDINCVLGGSTAHPVNRAALSNSVAFINGFVQYIDTTMDMLHVQSGFSKKAAWALITQLMYRIFMDMSAVREGTLASLRSDDPIESCSTVLWCIFRTQDKMSEFASQGFANHSSISSEYVKFLAGHSSVGDLDKLQKELVDTTKTAKAAKEEAVKATSKADKASSQADKVSKTASDHTKSLSDLHKDVKKLNAKVF